MNLLDRFTKAVFGRRETGEPWWVEIVTQEPKCTYYFGPYDQANEAHVEKSGFLEDLHNEGARGIQVTVKRCQPQTLTIEET